VSPEKVFLVAHKLSSVKADPQVDRVNRKFIPSSERTLYYT
jgi:hypothetical protein